MFHLLPVSRFIHSAFVNVQEVADITLVLSVLFFERSFERRVRRFSDDMNIRINKGQILLRQKRG